MSKNPRDRYGPPLEDSKQKRVTDTGIIGTTKQVLQSPASDSKQVSTYPSSSNRLIYSITITTCYTLVNP